MSSENESRATLEREADHAREELALTISTLDARRENLERTAKADLRLASAVAMGIAGTAVVSKIVKRGLGWLSRRPASSTGRLGVGRVLLFATLFVGGVFLTRRRGAS